MFCLLYILHKTPFTFSVQIHDVEEKETERITNNTHSLRRHNALWLRPLRLLKLRNHFQDVRRARKVKRINLHWF